MKIGIALVAYSRHDTLRKVISAIIKEKIREISIYIDGPENKKIEYLQSKIFNLLNQFKNKIKVNIIKQSKNNGLAFSITNAINSELKNNDAVILLEDDCVPQKGFFDFMQKSLKKYKNKKKVRSICSYSNLDQKNSKDAFFLKRFNPWGWATWADRWSDYNLNIESVIKDLRNLGKIKNLPLDLKTYCENNRILSGSEDIWSLSWTLIHYKENSLVLYPPKSLIENIGFDGSGVHCIKTSAFKIKTNKKQKKIYLPDNINLSLNNEIRFNNFLIENSSKTYFKQKKLDAVEPFTFLKKNTYTTLDELKYFIERFTYSTKIIDIHTHLFPSKFKKYHKIGLLELLNYHYIVAEFLSKTNYNSKIFYKLNNYKRAELIWNLLFLNQPPISTATLGIVKTLQAYGISNIYISFKQLHNIFKNIKVSENDIFYLANIENVVMTNNPFDLNEFKILNSNFDIRYKPSIRIDDLFNKEINLKKFFDKDKAKLKNKNKLIYKFFERIILKYSPAYFALSTENFKELEYKNDLNQILKLLAKYNTPLMLLVGVKRNVNKNYKLAGDGIGNFDLEKLESFVRNYPKNKFLVTCLDNSDQFKLSVLARKFPNIKIFGFWWFNNQNTIVENLLKIRIELLGDNFIVQHSDARILDQLIYKWNDFRSIYTEVLYKKFKELIESGYKIKTEDIEKYIFKQFNENPLKSIKN